MMSTYLRVAFRNLNRQKKRTFLLGGAIAFGILIVTFVNSFTVGVVANLEENFAHLLAGHIYLSGMQKSESGRVEYVIRDDSLITAALKPFAGDIQYISRRISVSATLMFEGESALQTVSGVDWNQEKSLEDRMVLKQGSMQAMLADPRGIILSEPIAKKLNVGVGDAVLAKLETVTGQQNVGDAVVEGIAADSGLLGSTSAYVHMSYAAELVNLAPGEYNTLSIFLKNPQSLVPESGAIYRALASAGVPLFDRVTGGTGAATQEQLRQISKSSWDGVKYQFLTINDFLGQVNQIASALQAVGIGILVLLFLIIMVGIINTFRMIMYERVREIGTMRAIGMQRGGVRRIFILEALVLALGSAVAGILVARIVMLALSFINFGTGSAFYLFLKNGHLLFPAAAGGTILNVVVVAVLTLLAVLFPASRAAKLDPAKALGARY